MSSENNVKKVVACVRVLLENKGLKVKNSELVDLLKDEDLSNPILLSEKIAASLPTNRVQEAGSERKNAIEKFLFDNWDLVKTNKHVKEGLLNLYAMGRINKENRQRMVNDLLERLGETQSEVEQATSTNEELLDF